MNKTITHILTLCTLIIAGLLPCEAQTPLTMPVISPAIPSQIKFAGQTIDLDPVDRFERFDRELTAMMFTHGTTLLTLKRANKLFPVMAPILKQEGVPTDLLYLACVESHLDPTAVSPARAAGLWQFMPASAREYGLEVSDDVDERFDVEKSTRAACRFLKSLYRRYGKWESVAAAYNGGPARITTELDSQMVDTAFDLYLTQETSRYIFRVIAMKEILENPRRYGYIIPEGSLYQPVEYRKVTVDTPISSWAKWAKENGTTYLTLRRHNPWIRSRSMKNKRGKTYTVLIPTQKSGLRSTGLTDVYTID